MRPVEFQTRTAVVRARRSAGHDWKRALEPLGPDLGGDRKPNAMLLGAAAAGLAAAGAAILNYSRGRAAERAHPPIGRFLTVDGVALHYVEEGEGPPVVLLHGNGAMVEDFVLSGLMDRLAASHRVIAIDRPGFGYSERPRMAAWTAPAQARLLRRTVQRLGVERPVVVGHSWGAIVAMAWALDYQEELAGIVLLSGYYYPTARRDVLVFGPPGIPVVGDVLRYTIAPPLARLILPQLVETIFAPAPVPRRFAVDFPFDLCLRPWQLRASGEETGMMIPGAAALQGRYGELRLRVTIFTGDQDQIVSARRQSMRLHRDIPHSGLHVLPGLGHMIHHFAQDEIAASITAMTAQEHHVIDPIASRRSRQSAKPETLSVS